MHASLSAFGPGRHALQRKSVAARRFCAVRAMSAFGSAFERVAANGKETPRRDEARGRGWKKPAQVLGAALLSW
jgi:hypothetical protein